MPHATRHTPHAACCMHLLVRLEARAVKVAEGLAEAIGHEGALLRVAERRKHQLELAQHPLLRAGLGALGGEQTVRQRRAHEDLLHARRHVARAAEIVQPDVACLVPFLAVVGKHVRLRPRLRLAAPRARVHRPQRPQRHGREATPSLGHTEQ